MPEIHEEYRVVAEWAPLPGEWQQLTFCETGREADATCTAADLKRKGYHGVRIERRVVTVGGWKEVKNVR